MFINKIKNIATKIFENNSEKFWNLTFVGKSHVIRLSRLCGKPESWRTNHNDQ